MAVATGTFEDHEGDDLGFILGRIILVKSRERALDQSRIEIR